MAIMCDMKNCGTLIPDTKPVVRIKEKTYHMCDVCNQGLEKFIEKYLLPGRQMLVPGYTASDFIYKSQLPEKPYYIPINVSSGISPYKLGKPSDGDGYGPTNSFGTFPGFPPSTSSKYYGSI